MLSTTLFSQAPRGFSYQAVARYDKHIIANEQLRVYFSIMDPTNQAAWIEYHDVETDNLGSFSQVILDDDNKQYGGYASNLADIDWGGTSYDLKVVVEHRGSSYSLGRSPIKAVPLALYALNAAPDADSDPRNEIQDLTLSGDQLTITNNSSATPIDLSVYKGSGGAWTQDGDNLVYINGDVGVGTVTPEGRLSVQGVDETAEEPLFMVKRKDGYPVFAVYEDGVFAYTDTADSGKGIKGGIAVGGYKKANKGLAGEYMRVTADSIRFYIDQDQGKGIKGGYAVGGYKKTNKDTSDEFLRITADSVRIYIDDDPDSKGLKGGYAVGGYKKVNKGNAEYFNISGKNTAEIINGENRMVWYPQRNALLAGRVLVESPDSVGTNSMATGYESKSIGNWSQALGYQAIARGDYSTAIGRNAIANDNSSFAFGNEAEAKGINSFAFGQWANARNEESYALGKGAVAEGFRSFAFGSAGIDSAGVETGVAHAIGDYSFAVGQGSTANGFGSFSMGLGNLTYGDYATAIGYKNDASGKSSISMGYKTKAWNPFSTAIGYYSKAAGLMSTAIGHFAETAGQLTLALGTSAIAWGHYSTSVGYVTNASGYGSTAMGRGTTATGEYSTAMGCETEAQSFKSFVVGSFNQVYGSQDVWNPVDPIFVVGNGESSSSRSDAFVVLKDGSTHILSRSTAFFGLTVKSLPGSPNYSNGIDLWCGDATGTNRTSAILFRNASGNGVGSIVMENGSIAYNTSSDKRLKTNIKATGLNCLDIVKSIPVMDFSYIDNPAFTHTGFIAQDIEQLFPNAVSQDEDGVYQLSQMTLIPVLTKAIQEQQKQIEEKDRKIASLEERLNNIEDRLAALE